jgi:hypothetical protein
MFHSSSILWLQAARDKITALAASIGFDQYKHLSVWLRPQGRIAYKLLRPTVILWRHFNHWDAVNANTGHRGMP